MNNHFTIAIDACNQEKWIEKCVNTCLLQNYDNFEVILVDALSDDKTYEICKDIESKSDKFKVYQNEVRIPQIANMVFLTKMAKENTIVVSVDGDDWLPDPNVLSRLNDVYNSREILVTYGSYVCFPSGQRSDWAHKYPDHVISHNMFRDYPWVATHLRTYKRELFLKINESDFKREDGDWLDTTGDMAFMIPMLEMAGSRSAFISDTMYVYNMANESADSYLNRERQLQLEKYIRSKPKYKYLDNVSR